MAYSSSSLPESTPSFYSNDGSSVGSKPDVVRMEEPIGAD